MMLEFFFCFERSLVDENNKGRKITVSVSGFQEITLRTMSTKGKRPALYRFLNCELRRPRET